MFDGIRRLLTSSPVETESQDAFNELNTVAPLKTGMNESSAVNGRDAASFVCREAVLDRKERIAGYEFALGRELQARMLEKSELIRHVYDDAMLRNLAPLGVSSLLGSRFAFLKLSVSSLRNPLLKSYANMNTVIMITPGKITKAEMNTVRSDLHSLKKLGIKHGLTVDRPVRKLPNFCIQPN